MIWRLISAAIFISAILTVAYFDYQLGSSDSLGHVGVFLVPVVIILTGMAAQELTNMIASRNPSTPQSIVICGAMVTIACACAPVLWKVYPVDCPVGKLGWNTLGLSMAVAIAIVFEMIRFKAAEKVISNLAYSIFVIVYAGFLMGFLAGLRFYDSNEVGMTALMSLLVTVKLSDAGAFFVGKMFGRNKLAPKMSPAKSVEGAIGAVVTGAMGSVAFFMWVAPWLAGGKVTAPIWACVLFGVVIAVTGMVGDLFESIIKRDFKAKDSSSWLRGLGGILDVFDSILAAAPAAYVLWVIGMFT